MKSINYVEKDYDTIFKEMIKSAYAKNLLSEDEYFLEHINNLDDIENNYVMLESVYAWEINQIYKDMTLIYESNDIDKATGKDLDIIGAKLGMPRPRPKYSQTELIFTRNVTSNDETIPKGTIVRTIGGTRYITITTGIMKKGENSVSVQARSIETGYESRVGKNTLNIIEKGTSNINVTNPRGSGGGRGAYNDKEYRLLLKAWTYSHIKGTKEAYEWYFANRDGVDGYNLVPLWDGTGTVKCIIDPPNPYIEEQVSKELLQRVQLFDDDVLVVGAREVTIDVDINVNVNIDEIVEYSLPEMEEIALRVENAIHTYINGGYYTTKTGARRYYKGMQIGEDFIPHKCAVFLDSQIPELKTINFTGVNKAKPRKIRAEDFVKYDKVAYELNMERLVGDRGGSCEYNTLLNMDNPYELESDSKGFTFTFYDKNNRIIKTSSKPNFSLEGLTFENTRLKVTSQWNGSTVSFINIIPKQKVGDISGSYITIDEDEVCVSGNINVEIE